MEELSALIQDMNAEAGLLIHYARLEEELQRAVADRKWDQLENLILKLRKKSDLVNQAEDKRALSFEGLKSALGVPADTGFFKVLPLFGDEHRSLLTESYRKLKIAVYSVKSATLRLSYYFQSVSDTVKDVLAELFPHRKGRMYARNGKVAETIDHTLVLNKSL